MKESDRRARRFHSRRKAALLTACGMALLPTLLTAQSDLPLPPGRPPEWGLAAGSGFSVHLNRGRASEHVLLFVPSVSFRVSSRLEYLVEGHFAQYLTPRGYMIGLIPLRGRLDIGNGRTLPYVNAGLGFGWTELTELEEINRRFNFLVQPSIGVSHAISESQP